jgi:hypothetical protein
MDLSKEERKELKEEINEEKREPMDDSDIRDFLPDVKIMRYADLKDYKTIQELLPNDIDYCIILYQESENKGHWVAVLRYNNTFEFFDPYSSPNGEIDEPLLWTPCLMRMKLGVGIPFMTRLFNNIDQTKYKAIYNPIKYQILKDDVNSCGRHCTFRILNLIKKNRDLEMYYKHMVKLSKKYKLNFDDIVTAMIPDN